jgi:alpha-L-rhamnosidase
VSNWSIDARGLLTWNVTVPPNTTASAIVPTADEKTITENGQPLAKSKGIKPIEAESGQVILELEPGTYEFRSTLSIPRKL